MSQNLKWGLALKRWSLVLPPYSPTLILVWHLQLIQNILQLTLWHGGSQVPFLAPLCHSPHTTAFEFSLKSLFSSHIFFCVSACLFFNLNLYVHYSLKRDNATNACLFIKVFVDSWRHETALISVCEDGKEIFFCPSFIMPQAKKGESGWLCV